MTDKNKQSEMDKLEKMYDHLYWLYLGIKKENKDLKRQLFKKNKK